MTRYNINIMSITIDKNSFEPSYLQLKKEIIKNIDNGVFGYGAQVPSVRKLIEISGLSHVTVARAVSELISEGILENRKGNGTFVFMKIDRGLKRKKLAVINPDERHNIDPYITPAKHEILSGIVDASEQSGVSIEMISSKDFLEEKWSTRPDGAIILQSDGFTETVRKCEKKGIPLIKILRYSSSPPGNYVDTDHYAATYLLTDYLLKKGHRKIAFCQHKSFFDFSAMERLRAYRDALAAAGVNFDNDLILEASQTFSSGFEIMNKMIKMKDRPTAVQFICDVSVAGAIKAALEENVKIPEDISITGYMGLELMKTNSPRITTVALKFKEIGRTAVLSLNEIITPLSKINSVQKIIRPELIIGDT